MATTGDLAGFANGHDDEERDMTRTNRGGLSFWSLVGVIAAGLLVTSSEAGPRPSAPRTRALAAARFFSLPQAPSVAPVTVQPQPKLIPRKTAPPAPPAPIPEPPLAKPQPAGKAAATVPAVRLYGRVRYKDTDEVPAEAIPLVIQVPDPCSLPPRWMSWTTPVTPGYAMPWRNCARPRMVNIKVCVPRGGVRSLRVGQHVFISRRIRYDFGEYKVDIRLKNNGWIEVDYQD